MFLNALTAASAVMSLVQLGGWRTRSAVINEFSIDFQRGRFFTVWPSVGALEAGFVMFSGKSNAIKRLNFPSRRLNITIKHRAKMNGGKWWKFLLPLCFFRTAHNMNEPLMYVWLCFNNPFSVARRGGVGKFRNAQCEKLNNKQQHWQNGRVDEEIIAQFSLLAQSRKSRRKLFAAPDSETSECSLLHTFPRHSEFSFMFRLCSNFKSRARSHTTRSAAISANNGEPSKPQVNEYKIWFIFYWNCFQRLEISFASFTRNFFILHLSTFTR